MHWPWQRPAADEGWREAITQKLATLEESLQTGQDRILEPLELLESLPRMARQVARVSATLGNWEEKREAEVKEASHLQDALHVTTQHLMQWVDELAIIVQKGDGDNRWHTVHRTWLSQAESVLAHLGYVEIPVLGQPFDATIAEAVGTVTWGLAAPYTVVEVVRRGYRFQGQLWRRAEVITVRPADLSEEDG